MIEKLQSLEKGQSTILTSKDGVEGGAHIARCDNGTYLVDCNGFLLSHELSQVIEFINNAEGRQLSLQDIKNIYNYI